jgi:hypothetical protein
LTFPLIPVKSTATCQLPALGICNRMGELFTNPRNICVADHFYNFAD